MVHSSINKTIWNYMIFTYILKMTPAPQCHCPVGIFVVCENINISWNINTEDISFILICAEFCEVSENGIL